MLEVVPSLMIIVIQRLTKEHQDALASAADVGAESIAHSHIMKSFGAEEWEARQYSEHISMSY